MKAKFILLATTTAALMAMGQQVVAPTPSGDLSLRKLESNSFKSGEYLKYRIHYGVINAGVAELKIDGVTKKNGRSAYHLVGTGKSVGMAEWFFKTRDRYESWMDTEAFVPWEFIRDVNEGGFEIKRHIDFDQYNHTAKDRKAKDPSKVFDVANNCQDLLSAFYYARTFDQNKLNPGDVIPIDIFLDHEVFTFQLKYLGKEKIKTKFGKVMALKLRPMVQSGRVFKDSENVTMWVTDDANKTPILLKSELLVGSIKMELDEYRNNVAPFRFEK